jgi:hypothetical protein
MQLDGQPVCVGAARESMELSAVFRRHHVMPHVTVSQSASRPRPFVATGAALVLLAILSGCGTVNSSAQVGPDLKPRFGTSISLPLGKE